MIPYLKMTPQTNKYFESDSPDNPPPPTPLTSNKRPDPKYSLLFSCLQITLLARKIFQLFLVGIALVYLNDRGIERA